MRFRSTLILLIIAAVIGIAIIILNKNVPPTAEWDKLKKQLVPITAENLRQVRITRGAEQIICEKDKNKVWQITAPVKTRADQAAIENSLAFEITRLSKTKSVPVPDNPAKFGLDKPRLSLKVTDDKNQTYMLQVGADAAMEQGVYLQKEGDPNVYLAEASFWQAVNKSLTDLRDKRVITLEPDKINTITIRRPLETVEFTRQDSEKWSISKPISETASTDKVRFLVSELDGLQAQSFVDEHPTNLTPYGLDRPILSITLSGTNQSETILWGSASVTDTGKIYVTRRSGETVGPVVMVEIATLANVNTPLKEFRVKKLFALSPNEVNRIETRVNGAPTMLLSKTATEWTITQPTSITPDWETPAIFINHFNETQVEEFTADNVTDLTTYGLVSPVAQVTFGFNTGQPDLIVSLSPGSDTNHSYLKKSNENRVLLVKDELFNLVKKGSLFFREKNLLHILPTKISRCAAEKGNAKIVYLQEKPQVWGVITGSQGTAFPADINQVFSILNDLCYLTAKEFITANAANLADYGLDKPAYRVELEYTADTTATAKSVIAIGKATPEGDYYARLEPQLLVFLLPPEAVTPLTQLAWPKSGK